MMDRRQLLAATAGATLLSGRTQAQVRIGVDRIYDFDCGDGIAGDASMFSPGVDVGQARPFANSCYLIRHTRGLLIWDTGLPDALASKPDGQPSNDPRFVHWWLRKTLESQIRQLGLTPSDIALVGLSHTHPDHIGNLELFPAAPILIQRAEYDWSRAALPPQHAVMLLDGDHDVFGDGSVTMVSTPGHTPGHQSLLVRLPQTGAVLLSGDAVHFQSNFDHRRVPDWSEDVAKTYASMDRLADVLARERAQMWINHDKPQRDRMTLSPAFYA